MSELLSLRAPARASICIATLGLTLGLLPAAGAAAQPAKPAAVASSSETAPPLPGLRSRLPVKPPVGAAGEAGAVRLMVFSLERRTVFDALAVVRPLLSVQGSVELDPNHGTISVRDNLAALSRVATAIRAFDRASLPVRIDVSLILAETAKISPSRPDFGIEPDLLTRLRQLMRFNSFSLLAHGEISSREGEAVVYDMAQGYRLNFELGSVGDGKRIRLSGFRMVRALPGNPEHELVRSVVNLGLGQPLILGLTRDEGSDRALMLVLRYQAPATPTAATAGH